MTRIREEEDSLVTVCNVLALVTHPAYVTNSCRRPADHSPLLLPRLLTAVSRARAGHRLLGPLVTPIVISRVRASLRVRPNPRASS